jgi:methylmalonyl-CoA mutase C-terminal domain/subunit
MSIKILLAKPGLDVHDRGLRVIARACRDAGMEVVYLGSGMLTVGQCMDAAVEEDVDVVGLSVMTGEPDRICGEALDVLEARGASDMPLIVGGVVRDESLPRLEEMGVAGVFTAGTSLARIIATIQELAGHEGPAAERPS